MQEIQTIENSADICFFYADSDDLVYFCKSTGQHMIRGSFDIQIEFY